MAQTLQHFSAILYYVPPDIVSCEVLCLFYAVTGLENLRPLRPPMRLIFHSRRPKQKQQQQQQQKISCSRQNGDSFLRVDDESQPFSEALSFYK